MQRFWCHCCARTFTLGRRTTTARARFDSDVVDAVVADYIEGIGSYRALARSYRRRLDGALSRQTINQWVIATGAAALTPLEMSRRLAPPGWGGWLGIDGKGIRIGSTTRAWLMIAVDQTSTDLVHAAIVPHESGDVFGEILTDVVAAGYPLAGVVCDFGAGAPHLSFVTGRDRYCPALPFQACRIHFARRCDNVLSGSDPNRRLKAQIRAILFAPTYHAACTAYWELTRHETDYTTQAAQRILQHLRNRFGLYMTHHRHPGLPADANITENVIRALTRRIRPMEHFATLDTANAYLRLLTAHYRWKPFTDSTNGRNGQSPLQHAGVSLPTQHWLTYAKQQHTT